MEVPREIIYNEPISGVMKYFLKKKGDRIMPELISGSSSGTILEEDIDVAIVKNNPTMRNWYFFLAKKNFWDDGERLINIENNNWALRYALARTFTGKDVAYDLKVSSSMFCNNSFLCFPEAMEHILKAGILDCTINWNQRDRLDLWATLDYREHYPDENADGLNVFYWYGQLNRNGVLLGKLELNKDDKNKY